jgi:serine protease Do
VEETGDVLDLIATKRVGESAELTVLRPEGDSLKEMKMTMVVGARPSDRELAQQPETGTNWQKEAEPAEAKGADLGIELEPAQSGELTGLRVKAVRSGSPAARAGVQKDDVLIELNRRSLGSLDEYDAALAATPKGQPALLRFFSQRFGQELLVAVPFGSE